MIRQNPKNPLRQYFANIWSGIATTYIGMRLTIRYFFSKPVTMRYPEVRPEIPKGHRGLHKLSEEHCMVCKACSAACPVECIIIESIGKGKDSMLTRFDIDYSRCLFCELCTVPCPNACITMTEAYDLASASREACILPLARPKSEAEIAAHKAMLAQKEAEKKAKQEAAKKETPPATEPKPPPTNPAPPPADPQA